MKRSLTTTTLKCDSDPGGTWYKYRINVTSEGGGGDIDSPNIAVDEDHVYLTADFFTGGEKYLFYVIEKAELLDDLEAVGFYTVGYGCTTCIGNSGPIQKELSEALVFFIRQWSRQILHIPSVSVRCAKHKGYTIAHRGRFTEAAVTPGLRSRPGLSPPRPQPTRPNPETAAPPGAPVRH